MGKLATTARIVVEDFATEVKPAIEKLAKVLNDFMDQVSAALNRGITISDNLRAERYEFKLAAGVSTMSVKWSFNEKPSSITIGILTKANGTPVSQVFSLSAVHNDRKIDLTFLGLDGATEHKVIVIAQV